MDVKITGLEALERKFNALPTAARDAIVATNNANALDFMQKVATIVPIETDGKHPVHLVSTLTKDPGKNPGSVRVSIGGPQAPYPAHLEYGHMTPDGHHVPAKPFWWTTWRVNKKLFAGRMTRAVNAKLKAYAAGLG